MISTRIVYIATKQTPAKSLSGRKATHMRARTLETHKSKENFITKQHRQNAPPPSPGNRKLRTEQQTNNTHQTLQHHKTQRNTN